MRQCEQKNCEDDDNDDDKTKLKDDEDMKDQQN